ncbi:hypothetical protein KIL84_015267 [Mauremys mutica]|uniref:Uncharacterized protein n=1 Tax=Mauremys mutica TaxID=74926 RepID=A0A9D4ARV4_9SAUR|nr:hypothetical protein KIL84_015267 [Mauremys mutica]
MQKGAKFQTKLISDIKESETLSTETEKFTFKQENTSFNGRLKSIRTLVCYLQQMAGSVYVHMESLGTESIEFKNGAYRIAPQIPKQSSVKPPHCLKDLLHTFHGSRLVGLILRNYVFT